MQGIVVWEFLAFLLQTVIISLTGVMAPGPLSATTVGKGTTTPHAGAFVAIGHGLVEFPLMVALFLGAGAIFSVPTVRISLALLGGAFLIFMGLGMLRGVRGAELIARPERRSPLIAGVLLTGANPYFLLWWATVGVALVLRTVPYGPVGFAAFAVTHWLCDFVWCYFLSALAFKGGQFFGRGFQKAVFALSGLFLLFLSWSFIVDGLKMLLV